MLYSKSLDIGHHPERSRLGFLADVSSLTSPPGSVPHRVGFFLSVRSGAFIPDSRTPNPVWARRFEAKGQIMLSKPTLELIVSEIVAGYGKIIKRKGKLIAVSSR